MNIINIKLSNILLPVSLALFILAGIMGILNLGNSYLAFIVLLAIIFLLVGVIVQMFDRLKPSVGVSGKKSDKVSNVALIIGLAVIIIGLYVILRVLSSV